jgi:hypothetical protein
MTLLFFITVSLFWGWITARLAQKKGLNQRNWYIAGTLFCVLAFIVLLFQHKKNPKNPNTALKPLLTPIDLSQQQNFWYYFNEKGQQFGPINFQNLTKAWEDKKIQEGFYVWNESLNDWKRFKEVLQITTPKI